MIRRHAAAAGIAAEVGCHTLRATGITQTWSLAVALGHSLCNAPAYASCQ